MTLLKASDIKRDKEVYKNTSSDKSIHPMVLNLMKVILDLEQGDYEVILGEIENRIKLYTFDSQENNTACRSCINLLNILQAIRSGEPK